jgi:transposase InsO family protein
MKALYEFLNISKQAHWKYMQNYHEYIQNKELLIRSMLYLRQLHPRMGAKKMYQVLLPQFIGRDAFIDLYLQNNLGLKQERSFTRTTFSYPGAKYKNLTINKEFRDINKLWTSDITYLPIGVKFFLYITFILDVFSRKILGFHASADLSAQASILALKMALNNRNISIYPDLIHHSDKGVQYTSNAYTELLTKYGIQISMCDSVYENTHIERVNGIIKNEYLLYRNIKDLAECQRTLAKAVNLYNDVRPHWSLNGLTPTAFEMNLGEIPLSERIPLCIYYDKNRYNCQNVNQQKIIFA